MRRIPQIAFEIGDLRGGDGVGIDVARMQILRGAEIGVHGALAVGRHQDVAARGRRPVGRGRRIELDAGRADVVREGAAELVVLDLADEGAAPAEARDADDRVGGRAARNLHRRSHRVVDRLRARLVDQRHAALGHALLDQEIVVGAREHIDDGVADAENVVAKRGHGVTRPIVVGKAGTIPAVFAEAIATHGSPRHLLAADTLRTFMGSHVPGARCHDRRRRDVAVARCSASCATS